VRTHCNNAVCRHSHSSPTFFLDVNLVLSALTELVKEFQLFEFGTEDYYIPHQNKTIDESRSTK
jgi:hypothetical protein